MANLTHLALNFNQLSGTVPDLTDQQDTMQYLSLAGNKFFGTIPDFSAFASMTYLKLSNNQLTGTLPTSLDLPALTSLLIGENYLHGSIPDYLAMLSVELLDVSLNFFSGTLPAFVSRQTAMRSLVINHNVFEGPIDHLIDPAEHTALRVVDISHNPFFGTLPLWLFAESIAGLRAGYNCFHGTLPAEICNAQELYYLDLSCLACHPRCTTKVNSNEAYFIVHHPVHGTLPACMFQIERLNNLIAAQNYFTGTLPESITMDIDYLEIDLSYNQLTGPIPEALQDLLRLSSDPLYGIDISNNKLSGGFTPGDNLTIPALDLSNNRMSGPSVESNWVKGDNDYAFQLLDGNIFACRADRSDLHPRDSAYERYDCGSDSVAKPLYALLACASALVVLVAGALIAWRRDNKETAVVAQMRIWLDAVQGDVTKPDDKLSELRRVMKAMKQLTKIALGCALAAVFVLAPMFAILSAYFGTHQYEYTWSVSSVLLSGRAPFALCFTAFLAIIAWAVRQLLLVSPPEALVRPAKNSSFTRKVRSVVACTLYLGVNFSVVGLVNVAFVAIETYATPEYQIAISVFKVVWSLTVAPFLSRYLAYELSAGRADWIVLELFVSVVCNIGIPLLAIVVVSPRCFFGLVGSQLSSVYSPDTYWSLMNYESRPFHYSYQCSFQFVNSYVAAFEYMCLLMSFAAPITALLIELLLRRTRPGGWMYSILQRLLPKALRPVATEVSSVPKPTVLNSFFDCTQFFVTQFTCLTMICTVGLVFPPLAATGAVAMVIAYYFSVLTLGRVLTNARAAGVSAEYAQLIENDCARVANPVTMRHAVWLLVGFCGVFYPIFLFDTLGDAVGVYEAYWVLIVVPLMAVVVVLLQWALGTARVKKQDRGAEYGAELQMADLYGSQDVMEAGGEGSADAVGALRAARQVSGKGDAESGYTAVGGDERQELVGEVREVRVAMQVRSKVEAEDGHADSGSDESCGLVGALRAVSDKVDGERTCAVTAEEEELGRALLVEEPVSDEVGAECGPSSTPTVL